jgi:hypothetical protein
LNNRGPAAKPIFWEQPFIEPLLGHLSPLGEKTMSYEHDDKKA